MNSDIFDKFRKNLIHYLSQGDIDQAAKLSLKAAGTKGESAKIAGSVMGEASAFLYDNFFVKDIERYYKTILPHISKETARFFKALLEERIRLTHEWKKKLKNLYVERQAREIQDAVRTRDYENASKLSFHLLMETNAAQPDPQRAALLGNIFGTLENAQDNVEKTLKRLALRLPDQIIEVIKRNQKERLALIYKSSLDSRNQEWMRSLTIATAEMKNYLPLSTVAGEPDASDLDKFDLLIRSIVRCYYTAPHILHDIVNLLVEFCPHEVSQAGADSGRESRLFNALNPIQKRVAIDILTRLGKNRSFVSEIIKFARKNPGARGELLAVELLGGLKAEEAGDFLKGYAKERKPKLLRYAAIASLGSLNRPDVREFLKDVLSASLHLSVIGPQDRTEIACILQALAKISRNPLLSRDERNAIIRDVIRILDDKDSRVNVICAENFFLTRQEDIDEDLRAWAVERLVEGLWFKDLSPNFEKGPVTGAPSQRTLLGRKEPVVDLICQLGKRFLPSIIATASPRMIHYGSAYPAIAEIMSRIGDESAVPLLEKLLRVALSIEEKELGKYDREYYWDGAEESMKELEKDTVVYEIIYALNKIGGSAAERVIEDLYQKFQSGELPIPGKSAGDLVFKTHQRVKSERGEGADKVKQTEAHREISREQIEESLKILKKGFIFSDAEKRRLAKVGALQTLGSAKAPDALWDIAPHLEDKDPIIAAATMSAIIDYNSPPMGIEKLRYFLHVMVEMWKKGSFNMKQKIEKIMEKLHPDANIMKDNIHAVIKTESDHKTRYYLEKLFAFYLAPGKSEREESEEETDDRKQGAGEEEVVSSKISEWEQKKRYLEARRTWISSGKKRKPPRLEDFKLKGES